MEQNLHPLLVLMGAGSASVSAAAATQNVSPFVVVQFETLREPGFRALIDSGATHSCISRTAFESLAVAAGPVAMERWPRAKAPLSVTLADGAKVRPLGAVVLPMGMRTVRDTVVWADASFLILDGLAESVILGMDWEERMGVTRFLPARVMGLSTTAESRACYVEWAAALLESGTMRDIPAEVCTHLVPFTMGYGPGEIPSAVPLLPCREVQVEGGGTPHVSQLKEGGAKAESAPRTESVNQTQRIALRSLRGFTIPPQSEMGPVPVQFYKGLRTRRPL